MNWEPIVLRARSGEELAAERAALTVVEDRSRPESHLRLNLVRIRAAAPADAPPIVFLSGGPGEGAIQWAQHGPFLEAFRRVSQGADLILLDQRGCGTSERDLRTPWPTHIDAGALASEERYSNTIRTHLGASADALLSAGVPLHAYTVVESAHDLEDLRQALGVPRISLWAYSYGTHLAQCALRLHPDSIARVVLCGFEGLDQTLKLPSNIDAQFDRLDRLAADAGFDLLGDMRRALGLAQSGIPIALQTPDGNALEVKVGVFFLQHLASTWCGLSNRFNRLPALFQSIADGQKVLLEEAVRTFSKSWTRPLTFYLKDAASSATAERLARIESEAKQSLLGNAVNFPFPWIGETVHAGDVGDVLRQPLESDAPILCFTGELDGFTSTSNALESLPLLPNARHFEIEHAAHNDLISSPEVVGAIAKFLLSHEWPNPDERFEVPPPSFIAR